MTTNPGAPRKPGEPRRKVIDENAVRFLIGFSAILLPALEIGLACWDGRPLESISASYAVEDPPWARNLFVAFNFAIGTFMLAYNGEEKWESRFAKIGAAAAYIVALVPGRYAEGKHLISWLPSWTHVAATLVLFAVLFAFCVIFRRRAGKKLEDPHKKSRALKRRWVAYVVYGILMMLAALLFAGHWYLEKTHTTDVWHLLLVGETIGLVAFGLAWLTAAKFIFATQRERTCLVAIRKKDGHTDVDFLPSAETDPAQQQDPS